jgi:hypothetical protein
VRAISSFPTRETVETSSRLRGVLACRAAAYSDAVATPSMVLPPDVGGEALVVHHLRRRRSHAALLLFLRAIERPPLRPPIDLVLLDHQPALPTDGLAAFAVRLEGPAALRADQLAFGLLGGRVRPLVLLGSVPD